MANISLNHSLKTPHTPGRNKSERKQLNKSGRKTPVADRFVPDRSNFEMAHYLLTQSNSERDSNGDGQTGELPKKESSMYSKSLTENMLGVADLSGVRVLSYAQKPKAAPEVIKF